jgi:hypothetical protein
MPPGVAGLDGEPVLGPGEVEMNELAGCQRQRELTTRLGQSDATDRTEDVQVEPALARSPSLRRLLQPAIEAGDPSPPATAVRRQELRRLLRTDEVEVPGVLGGALEAEVVEQVRQGEEHSHRTKQPEPVVIRHVHGLIEPRAAGLAHPSGECCARPAGDGDVDQRCWHPAEAEEVRGGRRTEHTVGRGVELHCHRPCPDVER